MAYEPICKKTQFCDEYLKKCLAYYIMCIEYTQYCGRWREHIWSLLIKYCFGSDVVKEEAYNNTI